MGSTELTVAVPLPARDGATGRGVSGDGRRRGGWVLRAAQRLARLFLATGACMVAASLIPLVFGWHPYVVLSGSMAPGLRVGDVAIAAPVHPGDLLPGRIAVFAEPGRPGRLIVHRIQAVHPDGTLVTRGDANAEADSAPLPPDQVRGLVRLRLPMIALPAYWWRTGAWLSVGTTALVLIILMVAAYPAEVLPGEPQPEPEPRPTAVPHRPGRHRRRSAPAGHGRGDCHGTAPIPPGARRRLRHARRRGRGPLSRSSRPGLRAIVATWPSRSSRPGLRAIVATWLS